MTGPYAAQMSIEALLPEPVEVARKVSPGSVNITRAWTRQQMLAFAALVRAQALEEAARVCEATMESAFDECVGAFAEDMITGDDMARRNAAAIRAIAATKPENGP